MAHGLFGDFSHLADNTLHKHIDTAINGWADAQRGWVRAQCRGDQAEADSLRQLANSIREWLTALETELANRLAKARLDPDFERIDA